MKKGFTLIELLAVIVILAVIALIATPIVLNIINDSKESATLRSAEMYIKSAELSIAQSTLKNKNITDGTYNLKDGDICLNTDCTEKLEVEVNGKVPDSGTITMLNGSISELSLVLDGKEIYKNSNGELVYLKKLNDICKPVKEQYFATNPLEAGYEYECEVKPGTKYNFYVLSTETEEDGSINLIMDRNICSDGTVATSSNTCTVEWISWDEYESLGGQGLDGNADFTTFGPVTAMNYLNSATSTWNNIPNLNMTYDDEGEYFTDFLITGKARLPYLSEVGNFNNSNGYLYENLDHGDWDHGESTKPKNSISRICGYWTFTSDSGEFIWYVHDLGYVHSDGTSCPGVRPVINVKLN